MRRSSLIFALAPAWLALSVPIVRAGPVPAADVASYVVTFQSTWSSQSHPTEFPFGAHYSGLVGGTHDATAQFWAPGQIASPGIESMAELGSKFPLINEVNAAIATGAAEFVLSGPGLFSTPGSANLAFSIGIDHSRVTLVSMIAPSPDWFVGVHDLELLKNGQWVDQVVIELLPYDSGTDSGTTYTSANADTLPKEPIALIPGAPFTPGVALGTFTFQRTDTPTPEFEDLGSGLAGSTGIPQLVGSGTLQVGDPVALSLSNAKPGAAAILVVGTSIANLPLFGGTLVPSPERLAFGLTVDALGDLNLLSPWPAGVPSGTALVLQYWVEDPGGPVGFAASNAVCATSP